MRKPATNPKNVLVRLMVDKVATGQVFTRVLRFSPVGIIPPLPHIQHEVCDSSDQAAHYHALGPKLGTSSLARHFAGKQKHLCFYCFLVLTL